jgi:glyoxalase family protein
MQLEGIHHITAITGDAPRNVDFYARVLGLRLVKKTVNQDDPTVYHLFYADENGSPGADLTFFEYPGARRGSAGAGMVSRIVWRVASPAALDFWEARLGAEGVAVERTAEGLRFDDPEGLGHELAVVDVPDAPLVARSLEVPAEHALQGFHAVRAFAGNQAATERLLREHMGLVEQAPGEWEARGDVRGGRIVLEPPTARGMGGAGTVHHIAWATQLDEQDAWQRRIAQAGLQPTPVIDRFYFRSVYFREPGGVLFELATMGPGFTSDEPLESLGEHLSLPPDFEHLRDRVEPLLTPLPDVRQWRPAPAEVRSA